MCWYFEFAYRGCNHDAFNFCVAPCQEGENSGLIGINCEDAECSEFEIVQDCPRCNYGDLPTNNRTAAIVPELPDDFEWHVPHVESRDPGWREVDWNAPPRVGPPADDDDPPSPRTVPAPYQPPAEPRQSSVATNIPEHELKRKPGKCPLKRFRCEASTAEDERNNKRDSTDRILKRPKLTEGIDHNSTVMSASMPPPAIPPRNPARLLDSLIDRAKAPSSDGTSPAALQWPTQPSKIRPRPTELDLSLTCSLRPNEYALRASPSPSPHLTSPFHLPSPLLPRSPSPSPHTSTTVQSTDHDVQARLSTSVAMKVREVVRTLSVPAKKLSGVWQRLSSSASAKSTGQGKNHDAKGKDTNVSAITPASILALKSSVDVDEKREDELEARTQVREVVSKEMARQTGKWGRVLGQSV